MNDFGCLAGDLNLAVFSMVIFLSWKTKYVWLKYDKACTYCNVMQCTYCNFCAKTNSFTAGNSNFRMSTLERHVVHSDHQASVLAKSHSKI